MSRMLTINIETPNGLMFEGTQIPTDYTVEQLINELIDSGPVELPRITEDGTKIEYSLHTEKNIKLAPEQLIGDTGIKDGDNLRLTASHKIEQVERPPLQQNEQSGNANGITVLLSVLDVNRHDLTELSATRPVGELIRQIVQNYSLPSHDKLGQRIKYKLQSKALGRFLEESSTLRGVDIPRGDRLTLHREEIAGA